MSDEQPRTAPAAAEGQPLEGGATPGGAMTGEATAGDRDPFAPVAGSPRGRTVLAVLGLIAGVAAAITGLAPVAGPLGMILGLVAHVKGSRLGMPATVVAAVGTIVGFTIIFLLR